MNPLNENFTVSNCLIVRLHEAGLRDVFTVPGDYVARWFDYIDAKERNPGSDLTRLGCRSELEAGYAADAYGRLNGIACAAVTYGVGAFPPGAVAYARFFQRMLGWVEEDMTLVPDESSSMYVSCNIPVKRANGFVSEAAWGSIGYASAAAFGLSIAAPQHRPVVFAGDGGFQMVAQTVSSMAHYGLNPIIFVMENAIYGIEQALTNDKTYTEDQPFNAYNKIPKWDYAAFAVALGAKAVRVTTLDELDRALATVKGDKASPWLVQVVLPERDIPSEILRLATNEAPVSPAEAVRRVLAPAE